MKSIVHISEVDISLETGMGRVETHWKKAFEDFGMNFIHIGPKEVGHVSHKGLFPYAAFKYFKNLNIHPRAIIAHEPTSGLFVNRGIPCFVESHGVERRAWENKNFKSNNLKEQISSYKTRLLFPLWRLHNCDKGLKHADKLLLINSDDSQYVKYKYKRNNEDIFVFKNGVNFVPDIDAKIEENFSYTIVFNGTWIERKGIHTLIKAANLLYQENIIIKYLLIGTIKNKEEVLADWPEYLHSFITVVPRFVQNEEVKLLSQALLFILPSFSEGQPLSLLQAMAIGKCCITTNCCGQKDIITNDIDGLLFEPGNHEELALLIKRCVLDTLLCQTIGLSAKEKMKNFNWKLVSDEVANFVLKNS
ncbi:MAG: glycosyltransferase family 4 protein [Sporocytophaga sp.]|uniref:glycosyltransferase family 4 protein n=1 Tax=Sporocytophaga sp. TaxID=2231183 RepID=UPI001B107029|nr:glycosyltransferase family 4 protein [Sporocytophaga sp.]MBO9699692.1 glycosyltransferase family 4 protein [Sporocytophaga sp.]